MPNRELPPDGPIDVGQFESVEVKLPRAILDHFNRSSPLVAAAVVEAYMHDVAAAINKLRRDIEEEWSLYAERLYEALGAPVRGDQSAAIIRRRLRKLEDKGGGSGKGK
jgi:hypothetical protein